MHAVIGLAKQNWNQPNATAELTLKAKLLIDQNLGRYRGKRTQSATFYRDAEGVKR